MRVDQVVIAVATPVSVALLYFLVAGEVSASEAVACAPVLVIACGYAWALARSETVALKVPGRGLLSLLRAFGAVIPDSWRVGRGLCHAVWRRPAEMQGVIKHVPFRHGGSDSGNVGRRASVVTAVSLAPNGFAIGMNPLADELIVHQLVPDAVGGDREWPV